MAVCESLYGIAPYNPPKKIMTHDEYRKRVDEFGKGRNLTVGDEQFFAELDGLRDDLYDMIVYDTSELEVKGKKYYVSTSGDDQNDGLSPETPWATLERVTNAKLQEGDGVYFKRGDLWRGNVILQSGVIYQAYGEGPKPKIFFSRNGKEGKWVKTDLPNVWVYDEKLNTGDVGVIVFDGGKSYAYKKLNKDSLKGELDFYYSGTWSATEEDQDENKLYLYCAQGNPGELFEEIEISLKGHTVQIDNCCHDITIHNLDVRYGQDYFFNDFTKNIVMSYCVVAWMGGHYFGSRPDFYGFGGGGGCWRGCDYMEFSHCFFTQHFDCSASPQFDGGKDCEPAIFKNFLYHDCLVEYTEYSVEYFNVQSETATHCFDGFYVGYNFMRHGGEGFGDKKHASRYIKSWDATNTCYNTVFEHNIFDRAKTLSIEIVSGVPGYEASEKRDRVSYDYLPKLRENIYIEPYNKQYANVNKAIYSFNESAQITLEKLGVEENSTFIYDPKK